MILFCLSNSIKLHFRILNGRYYHSIDIPCFDKARSEKRWREVYEVVPFDRFRLTELEMNYKHCGHNGMERNIKNIFIWLKEEAFCEAYDLVKTIFHN